MTRTQHEADLCALLVDDVYGELPSRIFRVLLQRGRLTIPVLFQQTSLQINLLKQGLVVLIQQNLIYYHHDLLKDITYYEANWEAAFALARSGRILDLIQGKFGEDTKDVVQNLLLLGHTSVGDLVEAYAQKKAQVDKAIAKTKAKANGADEDVEMTNGDIEKAVLTQGQLETIIYELLQCGYLQPVSAAMFKSPADLYHEIEQEESRNSEGGAKGSKKAEALKSRIRDQMIVTRDKAGQWQRFVKGHNANNKRPRDGYDSYGPDKRRKLTNGTSTNGFSQGFDEANVKIDPNMVVRLNHEKIAVALRNQHLVELAEGYIGVTTSLVYSTLLDILESKTSRCRRDPLYDDPDETDDMPVISTAEIAAALPLEIDMGQGIGETSKTDEKMAIAQDGSNESKPNVKANGDAAVHGHPAADSDSEDDVFRPLTPEKSNKVKFEEKNHAPVDKRVRLEQIRQHLLLLSEDNRKFVSKNGGAGRSSWSVNFEELGEVLRDHELDAVVFAKFQDKGVRLVRLLREKGKLDEKMLGATALMKKGEIGTLLVEMQMAGFVDLQEVPKDATRTAPRTLFLWYYDTARVTKLVTDSISKAMSRALQRLDTERFLEREAIETSQRTDVNGNLELLTTETATKLKRFLKKEEHLTALMAKLDKTAAVFREY